MGGREGFGGKVYGKNSTVQFLLFPTSSDWLIKKALDPFHISKFLDFIFFDRNRFFRINGLLFQRSPLVNGGPGSDLTFMCVGWFNLHYFLYILNMEKHLHFYLMFTWSCPPSSTLQIDGV